jgi:hypothetical protein
MSGVVCVFLRTDNRQWRWSPDSALDSVAARYARDDSDEIF